MNTLRIKYQTIEFGEVDIHVRSLRDHLQFWDPHGEAQKMGISSATWPLFGVLWDSSRVLAHLMSEFEVTGKRILEVGCGIALASLVLNQRRADIWATDYHPEAGNFLVENTKLNAGRPIPFVRTAWGDPKTDLGLFDLVIGSDLLYEADHWELLSAFINQHAALRCQVIIVDPGRGNHGKFSRRMGELGYAHTRRRPDTSEYLSQIFRGYVLEYQR